MKKTRKGIALLLAVCLLAACLPLSANAADSTDLNDVSPEIYPYYEAILWAGKNHIAAGTGGTKFSPFKLCTRAEAVTFLWRAAGEPQPAGTAERFSDVRADAYYAEAVQWAVEQGIAAGMGGGRFAPGKSCTRAEAVTLLWRAAGKPEPSENTPVFSDVGPNAYYAKAVQWAVGQEITPGVGSGRFGPENTCVRCQIVTFLYRCNN